MTDHSEFTVGGFSVKHLSTWHDALLIDSRQLLKLLLIGMHAGMRPDNLGSIIETVVYLYFWKTHFFCDVKCETEQSKLYVSTGVR